MVFVINRRGKTTNNIQEGKKEIGSWVIGYWLPKENFEINVWNCFENRFSKLIKAKEEQYDQDFKTQKCKKFSHLENDNLLLINSDCYGVLKRLDDNSVDYVITDPPHGDRQPYLELSMLWNTWLGFECDFENELVISNAKTRNKNVENYNKLLMKIILQIERVLKPGKYFTLMFNSLDNATWKNLQKTLYSLDMDIIDISTVDYSATSVVQDNRDVGLKTDFAFKFKKHQNNKKAGYRHVELEHLKEMTHSLMQQYIKRNDQARPYEILNYTVTSLMNTELFLIWE